MPAKTTKQADALAGLVTLLDLERLEDNLFRGYSPKMGWKRVYGGQVFAQSLVAAQRTVSEPRPVHSMHAYFLLAGDPQIPIIFEVERVRDGGSFTTRRVRAIQNGQPIFVTSASFQKHEDGYDHQSEMPKVPPPEALPSEEELQTLTSVHIPPNMKNYWARERPIEMRLVEMERYARRAKAPPVQHVWLRARGTLPDQPELHQAVLAYASDFTILDTALIPHAKLMFDNDVQMASLDHTIWIHRPFRADKWMLYAQHSPSACSARGLGIGSVYARDGTLIATVAQEGLMRKRTTQHVVK